MIRFSALFFGLEGALERREVFINNLKVSLSEKRIDKETFNLILDQVEKVKLS